MPLDTTPAGMAREIVAANRAMLEAAGRHDREAMHAAALRIEQARNVCSAVAAAYLELSALFTTATEMMEKRFTALHEQYTALSKDHLAFCFDIKRHLAAVGLEDIPAAVAEVAALREQHTALLKERQWVKVEERLPARCGLSSDSVYVQVAERDGEVAVAYVDHETGIWYSEGHRVHVTHWQPLAPAPGKEGGAGNG